MLAGKESALLRTRLLCWGCSVCASCDGHQSRDVSECPGVVFLAGGKALTNTVKMIRPLSSDTGSEGGDVWLFSLNQIAEVTLLQSPQSCITQQSLILDLTLCS